MQNFFNYVESHWVAILGELIVFSGGMVLGGFAMSLLIARTMRKIYISPKFKDADWNLARITGDNGREYVYLNPKSYLNTLEAWVSYYWWNVSGRRPDYILESPKLQRTILVVAACCLIGLSSFELYNVFDIRPLNTHIIEEMID